MRRFGSILLVIEVPNIIVLCGGGLGGSLDGTVVCIGIGVMEIREFGERLCLESVIEWLSEGGDGAVFSNWAMICLTGLGDEGMDGGGLVIQFTS